MNTNEVIHAARQVEEETGGIDLLINNARIGTPMKAFTLNALACAFAHGRTCHSLELVEHCLAQIDRLEDRSHAWVLVDRDARRAAARRAAEELAQGHDLGPLHGIPLGIKDIADVAGWPTLAGSRVRDNRPVEHDAPLVAQFAPPAQSSWAKRWTTEFACFDPPPTRNPWNLGRTPGGSSSGSAAAVATEMCVAAIGSQTAARSPAGELLRRGRLKPTFGCVSLEGLVPVSSRLDHPGPIGRSAGDWAVFCNDRRARARIDVGLGQLREDAPRIGWLQDFFISEASPGVRAATQTAVEQLRHAGATIEPVNVAAELRHGTRNAPAHHGVRRGGVPSADVRGPGRSIRPAYCPIDSHRPESLGRSLPGSGRASANIPPRDAGDRRSLTACWLPPR